MSTRRITANRLRRTAAAVLAAVVAGGALAGCSRTIEGRAVQEGAGGGGASAEFTKLLTECDAVTDEQIAESVGSDYVLRGFFGAICRWDGDGPSGPVKVTFNWFETGALDTEREAGERLGYAVENTTVEGRRALLMRRPADPHSCGVSANASTVGIFGWWVQYVPGSAHPDPCEAAATLARLTLNLSS
ncbi:DUF3558 domain-containing protein [Rhodococcus sp. NPDC003382]|uniref:DUF3558 domain-containing protein n=1 Tax=unclassified Rhodococcus (in: high G+C Gram-positive bacteria) TaxID=192944 RepID=UPI0018CF446B|nr:MULTISPECIES: DUF3558 domain-containing protein [unclassified Rhodococcus (in: high G+C Gram-positive bacteria)]MBH0119497.1 DUF3558 domain-containing protein [Rhodococcus sp. CX]MCK8674828.1 DUF3558 domain-containing protein [Rhodococcus sp. HM1]